MQYKAITGATYNNTIYLTYITKQYDYLFKFTIEFIPTIIIQIHRILTFSYCNNKQQNRDNLITYYDANFYTTITSIIRLHMLLAMNNKIEDTFLLKKAIRQKEHK